MPEPRGEDRQVKFQFEYDAGYRLVGANGVWSGITPRSDMKLDFFVESLGIPDQITHSVSDTGLGPELNRTPDRMIVRRVQVGVLLSLDQAERIADFIKKQIEDFRKKKSEAN
jgi:hypothetical protein